MFLLDDVKALYSVERIPPKRAHDMILNKHYARRLPSISYAYGLFDKSDELVGVLTIGKPASPSLCIGLLGREFSHQVFELNRLVVLPNTMTNALSFFVSRALKDLSRVAPDIVLVSYADSGAGHHGYIYQATNWWFTGATKERTDKYTPENKHSRHYSDDFLHLRKVRTSKYRYVFVPSPKLRGKVKALLKYPILPYPKGNNTPYVLGERLLSEIIDKRNNRRYKE